MALDSIHNIRGFFSDYWLGSVLSAKKGIGPRLAAAQSRKKLWRLNQLHDRVDAVEPPDIATFREKFARPLLADIFGFRLLEADDARLRLISSDIEDGAAPLAAVLLCPGQEDLPTRQTRQGLERALLDHDLAYGFILSPGTLRLIRRPGDGAAKACFDFSIATAVETDDIESLTVAYRVLSAENFVRVDGAAAPIELLEEESRKHSAGVSEDLKEAVFVSAELVIRGFLQDVRDRPREAPPSLTELRNAALQTLYRLLFILYAESRDERLQTHRLYRESYSLEKLIGRLLHTPPDEVAGNRYGLWTQLLALFEIYDKGMLDVPGLENIPPRGGTLFSHETPEGRLITQLRLPDRTVRELLIALATTRPRRGVGRERVSFRELEIEQLGSVYEGLLEYEPRVADGIMIDVRVQGREFVLSPPEVVRLCEQKKLHIKGDAAIVEGTAAATLHSELSEDEVISGEEEEGEQTEAGEEEEDKGVKRGAAALLVRRLDVGDFYFVPSSARKSSGSYYTREEIVQYLASGALSGLVEGRTPSEIESLRIIDIACGSAHFLVGAARWLGKQLLVGYQAEHKGEPPPHFYPGRELNDKVREQWDREGEAWCKRRIVEKCLFGVDLNPIAVQLAQVALWIESLAGDRPLSFFRHHVRCGNSLLGSRLDKLHAPPHPSLGEKKVREHGGLFELNIQELIARAIEERQLIDAPLPPEVRKDTPEEFEYKADRLRRAEQVLEQARLLFDLRSAAAFLPVIWRDWATLLSSENAEAYAQEQPWWAEFLEARERERFFHWELEFPEVFFGERRGFDVVLGNPPWDKVKPDRKEFYSNHDILIRAYTGGELDARIVELHAVNCNLQEEFETHAKRIRTISGCFKAGGDFHFYDWKVDGALTATEPDLFKFFAERAYQILNKGGRLGYLVPSAIYNDKGCTGLRHLILDQSHVHAFYGFENRKKIFPIDSRYKFVCLVIEKRSPRSGEGVEFLATFLRHDIEELSGQPPAGVQVLIKRSELEEVSPGTLAFLEYRSERDREIVLKMYGLLPGLTRTPLLGKSGEGTWNARFYREFHLSDDRYLWAKPDGTLWTPRMVLGPVPNDFQETKELMEAKGFWPLYQDAHIHQYVLEFKPLMRWVSLEAHERAHGRLPDPRPKLVMRRPARNTDERTIIAAILPERSCFGDTLNGVAVSQDLMPSLLGVFNSLCFDYQARKKSAGQDIRSHVLKRMAAPRPDINITPPLIPEIRANEVSTWVYDDERNWERLWNIERTVAEAFGLSASDLKEILTDFPGFARKRSAFSAFLAQQVNRWSGENGPKARNIAK
jgi:hypothetical protein